MWRRDVRVAAHRGPGIGTRASRLGSGGRCRCLLGKIDCARVVPASIAHKVLSCRCSMTTPDFELLELLRARPDAQCVHLRLHGVELGLQSRILFIAVFHRSAARSSRASSPPTRTSSRSTSELLMPVHIPVALGSGSGDDVTLFVSRGAGAGRWLPRQSSEGRVSNLCAALPRCKLVASYRKCVAYTQYAVPLFRYTSN